jgi:nicotinamide-nucleotide amidase
LSAEIIDMTSNTTNGCTEDDIADTVRALSEALLARGWRLCTAESCTGGLIAAACTERAGSSDWFERGMVSYSNASKTDLLGVPAELIEAHGAVSAEVAEAMARGAIAHAAAEVSIAVTGVAGPSGGSADKPVGTVWFGWALPGTCRVERRRFGGDRGAVRRQTVAHALSVLEQAIRKAERPA